MQWDELFSVIAVMWHETSISEEIHNMNFFMQCMNLFLNPVLLRRHFWYRVELSLKVIVVDGLLSKEKHHAICIECQVHGSAHVHSFLWVIDAPILR